MVQGEYMETVLSTKIKNSFPGLALLMAGFLAGLLIPNLIYRFSWKQQAFSAIYLLTAYGKTGAENRLSAADHMDERQLLYPFPVMWVHCIWGSNSSGGNAFYRA